MTTELIKKFFQKKCNEEEAQKIVRYLKNNPDVLDQFLSKEEWDSEPAFDTKTEEYWDGIWNEIKPDKVVKTARLSFVKYLVAASLIGFIVAAGLYFRKERHSEQIRNSQFCIRKIDNLNKVSKEVILTDGTYIKLSPSSSIEFKVPFQENKRDIILIGEATFKVARDKKSPFTVYSGEISTTALGTEFRVSSFNSSDKINVELFEGKVVVRSTEVAVKKMNKDFFLLPGDRLMFNKIQASANVIRGVEQKTSGIRAAKIKSNGNFLVFEKEPLSNVFDQLALKYKVSIRYSSNDLEQLYLIGSYSQTDSVQNILGTITKLNGLKLTKTSDGGYTITK